MDHTKHTKHARLAETELNQATLEGAKIYGPDDETIGTVSQVHGAGSTAKIVVDVGGFLGLGAKPVAINGSRLDFMRDDDGTVHATTMMSKDDLKALPEYQG